MNAYRDQYGICTQLELSDRFNNALFTPEEEVQLLRVIQEAVANARKHGGAKCITVSFEVGEQNTAILITDDGHGFDTNLLESNEPGHYGLQFMRERAEQIGGRLSITSHPDSGTQVLIDVPR
jgi:signal transduction histidine kinase